MSNQNPGTDTNPQYATLDYTGWWKWQRLLQKGLTFAFRFLMRVQVEGLEKIPRSGPLIAASNHLHLLDILLFFSIAPRRTIPLVSDYWEQRPFLNWCLTHVGNVIYISRNQKDASSRSNREALIRALTVLRSGGILGITPEGRISERGKLLEGMSGVAYFATRIPAPILPVVVYGHEHAPKYWKRLRRPSVHIRIGSLLHLPPGKARKETLQTYTHQVMDTLAQMLPPEYLEPDTEVRQVKPAGGGS